MLTTNEQFELLNYISGTKRTSRVQRMYNLAYTYLARNVGQQKEIKDLKQQVFDGKLVIKRMEQS